MQAPLGGQYVEVLDVGRGDGGEGAGAVVEDVDQAGEACMVNVHRALRVKGVGDAPPTKFFVFPQAWEKVLCLFKGVSGGRRRSGGVVSDVPRRLVEARASRSHTTTRPYFELVCGTWCNSLDPIATRDALGQWDQLGWWLSIARLASVFGAGRQVSQCTLRFNSLDSLVQQGGMPLGECIDGHGTKHSLRLHEGFCKAP